MSDFSLILVLQFKTSKIINGMANISIKSQKITPFGGIFHVMEKFDHHLGPVVDGEFGFRCTTFGYQYSEIARSLMSVYFCGGDCIEDVTSHLNQGDGDFDSRGSINLALPFQSHVYTKMPWHFPTFFPIFAFRISKMPIISKNGKRIHYPSP